MSESLSSADQGVVDQIVESVGDVAEDAKVAFTVGRNAVIAWGNQLVKRAATEGYTAALDTIHKETAIRQAAEDNRANHRNFNRMMTLFGALCIGLVVTWVLTHPQYFALVGLQPEQVKPFLPYAFTITIFLDSGITLYSYIRHY